MSNPTENATALVAAAEIFIESVRSIERNYKAAAKSGDVEAANVCIKELRAIDALASKASSITSDASMLVNMAFATRA